jgi:hypothetical protein
VIWPSTRQSQVVVATAFAGFGPSQDEGTIEKIEEAAPEAAHENAAQRHRQLSSR